MANKIYTVVKDGEELETLKTLTAAKKLADAEGAEVYSDGKCVYQGNIREEDTGEDTVVETENEASIVEEAQTPTVEESKTQVEAAPAEKKGGAGKYSLKAMMNVRAEPNGKIVKILQKGAEVDLTAIRNDWLYLTDGTCILFGKGEFAEII